MLQWIKTLTMTTITLVGVSGCATTVVDTSCTAFRPIRYSTSLDRPETVTQIREHNAAWVALCR